MAAVKGAGKGQGNAPPPPAPPLAAKGKGKAAPSPPAHPVKGAGKKGINSAIPKAVGVAPPCELLAPIGMVPPLRADHVLASAEGTMWEGLELWGPDDGAKNVLEAVVMDHDSLMNLWAPMPLPPERRQARQARQMVLPAHMKQIVEIAVKGTRLTPELARRALTEDMRAVSAEQAEALSRIAPMLQQAFDFLQVAVNRYGAESLDPAEAVLWVMQDIPHVVSRASLLEEQHTLPEDVAHVRKLVENAQSAVSQLRSRPMRTLLQMILAARNILAQEGHQGLKFRILGELGHLRLRRPVPTRVDPMTGEVIQPSQSWINEKNPSVLALVAQMIEKTHQHRCRLRFLRMLAVAYFPARQKAEAGFGPNVCRIIWSYLDDLEESPRDAVEYLKTCSEGLCNHELIREIEIQAMKFRGRITQDFAWLEQGLNLNAADVAHPFSAQVEHLKAEFLTALEVCDNSIQELSDVAVLFCHLAGEPRNAGRDAFTTAGEVLRSLRKLGNELHEEIRAVQLKHQQAAQRSQASKGTGRKWPVVDTQSHILSQATDPVLIRELRTTSAETPQVPVDQAKTEEPVTESCSVQTASAPVLVHGGLHGGLEGNYVRDPLTGTWGHRLDGLDGTEGANLDLGGP